MIVTYCTIITSNFIDHALCLYESLLKYGSKINFKILIIDSNGGFTRVIDAFPEIEILLLDEFSDSEIALKLYNKYYKSDIDCFRWSMKSVFISHLIEKGYDKVIYLDPDIHFFNSYDFLSKELDTNHILLSPHWRSSNPNIDPSNFSILQTSGLFNAGFIGVTKNGIPAMEWWSQVCLYECAKNPKKGLFVDQSYLDLMPIYFDNIKILKHRGCNIANWNQIECKRTINDQGEVKINNTWDIIFIHFTASTIKGIKSGQDNLLTDYLKQYENILDKYQNFIPRNVAARNQNTSLFTRIKSLINK